jgi:two-component system CheB/CheR fusion protein
VVGIGATVGGLAAFKTLLDQLPARTGMAFVVVPHLEPRSAWSLASLSSSAGVPVADAENAVVLRPDHAYVVPPGMDAAFRDGRLFLSDPPPQVVRRLPIDHLFRSLAAERKERSIGVLLSGADSDGMLGLREIKAAGGMTMIRRPDASEVDAPLPSALKADTVDFVIPVEEMPAVLRRYAKHPYVREVAAVRLDRSSPAELREVLAIVHAHSQHDFRNYKKATLNRRIQRRMGLRQVGSIGEYVELLRGDEQEAHRLFRDLLIGVTRLFRDPPCWTDLEEVMAKVVGQRAADRAPLRVWVPGCSTGEEVYSLGIVLDELVSARRDRVPVHLFGTDVDEAAVAAARRGIYPASAAEDVSAARYRAYFEERGSNLVVTKRLRDATVFATQDLLTDPPFSNLDLVSCRNVMIYLDPGVQRRMIEVFHFALRPGGILFLGPSESAARPEKLFEPISATHRIYRRVGDRRRGAATFPLTAPVRAARRVPRPADRPPADLAATARRALLEAFAPAAVLVNAAGEALYMHGRLREFFDFPPGKASRDVAALALPGLRSKLRAALQLAAKRGQRVEVVASRVRRGEETVAVRIVAVPVAERPPGELLLVGFEEVSCRPALEPERSAADPAPNSAEVSDSPLAAQLRIELQAVREDLLGTIEELESSNTELQTSNEEVLSMNEERQSANEELETSQEELQSLNEELSTVNSHLEEKLDQLVAANDDLTNLLASTEIATVFLDRDLRIRRFTPALGELLNVIESDVGRPLTHLAPRVEDPHLIEDCHGVLKTLEVSQREVGGAGERFFLRRILPYRTSDDRIAGVVVTFTDITDLRKASARVEARERQQALVAELGRKALASGDIPALFKDAVRRVATGLGTEFVKLTELLPTDELLLRAGMGWKRGLVGKAHLPTGLDSQSGFTLRSARPVVVEDLANERRFALPDLLRRHGILSGMSVIIGHVDAPWGVLGAHSAEERSFTMDDVHFLEAVANVVADAIARSKAEERLRRRAFEMSLLFHATSSVATSFEEALQSCIDAVCEVTGYPIGHAFVPSADGERLVSSGIWHVDDEGRTSELRELTEEASFARGEGFIGRIWETREVSIVPDLTRSSGFLRCRPGTKLALRGAFGLPVIVESEVAAILEFFSPEVIQSEAEPLDIVKSLGAQVGRAYERNRAAKSLREGADRLSLALEAAELGAFEWNIATGELSWNERHYRMLGYEPGAVRPTYELALERVHPDDRGRVEEALRAAERDRGPFECEYRVVLPDRGIRWMQAKGQFLLARDGSPSRMYGVLMDVTARLEMEAGLREADRRKDAFLSTLGHELRNPLGAVANGVQLLRGHGESSEETRELARMMERQVRLMTNLLNDLLDVGRISRGGVELNVGSLRVADLVDQAVETVSGDLAAGGHEVAISIEPDGLSATADPVRFEQILVNLLSNAARYTPRPGRIEVRARRVDGEVQLSVSDTGVGLTPEELVDIFEPFYQVQKGSGGLGLGLSLVRKLVELHGGHVDAHSAGRGRGSTFVVTLPLDEPAGEPEEAADSPARSQLATLRVLAIDDHEDSLAALGALLARHCSIATAATGEEGITKAQSFRPHVVLIDLALPDMSGFEVATAFQRDPELADTLRIAMTGFGDVQTESEVADAGFDEHLLKPLDFHALLEILQRVAVRIGEPRGG